MQKRPRRALNESGNDRSAGKRVKFGGAEEFPGNNNASDEEDLEVHERRNGVLQAGYDSDSTVGSDAEGPSKKDEGEDEDMFDTEKPAKKKEFLDLGDIEGQEFNDGSEVEDDIGEEDYFSADDLANDDEAPRGKRSKKSMGYSLSSFNMKEELSEGRFTADGSYVPHGNDPHSTHDSWLSNLTKAQIRAARESQKIMAQKQQKLKEREERTEEVLVGERDGCLIGLLGGLRPGESVASALSRLGRKKKAEGGKEKIKIRAPKVKRKDDEEDSDMEEYSQITNSNVRGKGKEREQETETERKIRLLTHYASTLLADHGDLEIYDKKWEDIVETLRSEGAVRRDWVPPEDAPSPAVYHDEKTASKPSLIQRPGSNPGPYWYKWINPQTEEQKAEFGPYSRDEIEGWIRGGYFGSEGGNIVVKTGTSAWGTWRDVSR